METTKAGSTTFRTATLHTATVSPGQLIPRHFIGLPPNNKLSDI